MQPNSTPPKTRFIEDDSEFALLAKACMEESDHMHGGLNDLGQMMIYPCGTEFMWVFDVSCLEAFLDRRNVAIANGSQYDFLHGILQSIKAAESQKVEPQPEPETMRGPAIKRGEAEYGDARASEAFAEALAQALFGQAVEAADPLPADGSARWAVGITYDLDEGDFGNMTFEVDALEDILERIRYMPFKNGATLNINVEFLLD